MCELANSQWFTSVWLTLGSYPPTIVTNNTEILITDIGERVLLVVILLSRVTLTWLPAVEVPLRTVVMVDWDSGHILMGVWYWAMVPQRLLDSSSTLTGVLPNSSGWTVDRETTPSLQPGPTVVLYQLLEEIWPSVPTWVNVNCVNNTR